MIKSPPVAQDAEHLVMANGSSRIVPWGTRGINPEQRGPENSSLPGWTEVHPTVQAINLPFERNLDSQHAAIEFVCDLFRGQEICRATKSSPT